jgi:hypothetical protein
MRLFRFAIAGVWMGAVLLSSPSARAGDGDRGSLPPTSPLASPITERRSAAPALEDSAIVATLDEDAPRPMLALASGAAVSLLSVGIGSMVIATSDSRASRNAGLLGMEAGLCLSPIVAHLVVGEPRRGLLFAAIPLTLGAALGTVMAFSPEIISRGPALLQLTFLGLVSGSVFGSALGVLDAARVAERRRSDRSGMSVAKRTTSGVLPSWAGRLEVAPLLGSGLGGAIVGGTL